MPSSPPVPQKSPLTINVRVRYAETDKMGVVYHANYFVWFEIARCELLRSIGTSYRELEATGIGLPVIEARCEYKVPAQYDDDLEVRVWGELLSGARVQFVYEIVRPSDGSLIATGRTVHAAVDGSGRPCRLPDYIKDLLQ